MKLNQKMQAIADARPRPSTKGKAGNIKELKQQAESLTAQHETAYKEADKHAHNHAIKLGHSPSSINERLNNEYEQHKYHYMQHLLRNDHPELHKTLEHLSSAAPQARLAYKRALRS